MKTGIKLLTVALAIGMTTGSLFFTKNAKAIYEAPKKFKVIRCEIFENGEIIQQGNRCDSGTDACQANPCSY